MSSAVMDLDQHLDCMESFPGDIQRNFALMRELDMRGQDVMKKIDSLSTEYIAGRSSMTNKKRKEMISLIEKEFLTSKSYADDKVQLATQVYEMVDKQIRLLDPKLAKLESYIKEVESQGESKNSDQAQSKKGSRKKLKEKLKPLEELPKKKKSVKKDKKMLETSTDSVEGGEALDMPVDPNEPTYCLCHQVSYGEMIGCDNPECPIEWFHFPCVNLMAKPQGKWFCPKCLPAHKKKNK